MKMRHLGIMVLMLMALSGCDGKRELVSPDDVGRLAVSATLYVDQPFPNLLLYRAQLPTLEFDSGAAGERGATVTIRSDSVTVHYAEWQFGVYAPSWLEPPGPGQPYVQPGTKYRLEVITAAGERLTAATTTPGRLRINEWVLLDEKSLEVRRRLATYGEYGDSVYYAPENQLIYAQGLLEARVDPVGGSAAYQAGIYSLDLDSDWVIDPEFLDDEDLEEIDRKLKSPLILRDETQIRLPWFAIFFQERYQIKIFAVDLNWYDLIRSTPELAGGGFGFGGNAGDDFDRPIFHVQGGIGLFGSASMDSVGFYVLPRP